VPDIAALVGRILDRAGTVDAGRTRVALLVSASQTVTRDLDLASALQHIVDVARELVGARFGALGVISPDGRLERFIHAGLGVEESDRIGHLPAGHGLLGAVISEGAPIRLDRLVDDPRSVGVPAQHPVMNAFLGVPVLVGDTVYGNLYLTEREGGLPFDELDQAIIAQLASMAGTAIANSRLYEQSRAERRWLEASERLNRRLFSGSLSPEAIDEVAETALAVSEAARVVVALGSGTDAVTVHAGGEVDEPEHTLEVPLLGADDMAVGSLTLVRGPAGHPFTPADYETAARFARSTTIARELSAARLDEQRLALVDERERIARDLHDHVIQSLFAIGLSLQSVAGDPMTPTGARLAAQVDALDATIRQIRQAIYRLSAPPSADAYSLRARINTLVRHTLEDVAIDSRLEFSGPVDTLVDTSLGDELAAVVGEALTNAVRHARASLVSVSVSVRGAEVVVVVSDDGIGMPAAVHRSGLENLRARAVELGGTFAVDAAVPHGTALRWVAPWKAE